MRVGAGEFGVGVFQQTVRLFQLNQPLVVRDLQRRRPFALAAQQILQRQQVAHAQQHFQSVERLDQII